MKIPFNKPHLTGKELDYIQDAVETGKISGNGKYTKKCHEFFERKYNFKKCLLTTSCSAALEMAAILLNIGPEDEVILPSYTFVSTANAFLLRGANLVFADSNTNNPNIDAAKIKELITPNTKAIVVVHYAGIACDMDEIMSLAKEFNLFVIEDAAQAIDAYYKEQPLGSIGHLSTFSFHETKNISSGEGGMLVINDDQFISRAEIIWENGTNRSAFFRGEVDKYSWKDIGSSFFPSELIAAYLYAQLESFENIQNKRKEIWNTYHNVFSSIKSLELKLPSIPNYATNNAHMFYLVCNSINERNNLLLSLKENGIQAVFHYTPLHSSTFFIDKHDGRQLNSCELYAQQLVRLPLFYLLLKEEQNTIIDVITNFFKND